MGEWRDAFLSDLTTRVAPKTFKNLRIATARFEAIVGPVEGATATALDDYVKGLIDAGVRPSSVVVYVSHARQFLLWCRQRGLDIPDPYQPKIPTLRRRVAPVLRDADMAAYLRAAAARREPYATVLALLPMCGLRVSEICKLLCSDIEIVKDATGTHLSFLVRATKHDDRRVPVLAAGRPLLGVYLKHHRPGLVRAGAESSYLFPNERGGHIRSAAVQDNVRTMRAQLGVTDLTPHTLRHTYVTMLSDAGVSPLEIAAIVGHRNLSTTQLYTHPSGARLSGLVERLNPDWTKGLR